MHGKALYPQKIDIDHSLIKLTMLLRHVYFLSNIDYIFEQACQIENISKVYFYFLVDTLVSTSMIDISYHSKIM